MTDPDEVRCPRCGCPVVVDHDDPDDEYDWGAAVCPNCGLERCAGMGCWCLDADGTPWRARSS